MAKPQKSTAQSEVPGLVKKGPLYYLKRDWQLYALMLLPMVFIIVFKYFAYTGLSVAFLDYKIGKGYAGSKFVGLKIFEKVFKHRDFTKAVVNTLLLNVLDLIFSFPMPIILALLLNEIRVKWFKRTTQTLLYLPHFLSWVVIGAVAYQMFATQSGVVNALIANAGKSPIPFLQEDGWWLFSYVLIGVWQTMGWGTIIYLAAITNVNSELYEAAKVDGAKMQFTWNIAQGVSSYNKQTGFGFVIGAVYNANAALRIPETNSSFLPQWWYAGTAICDVTCTEYGVQATATDAVRAEDLECRSLPVWFRVDVPAEGVYRTKITVTGTDGGEVLVFIGRRRLVWRGTLAAGENKTITAYCDVFPIVPRGQVDAVPSTAVNVTVVGGALAAAAVAEAPDVRRIWVCGDSTVTDQTANLPYAPGTSYCGWGQMLPAYLPDVCITNHAHSGLTTESFTSEGHWDIVKPRLRAGDICLYQFGHNDQKLAHLQAYCGYTDRLRTYIKETRTAGAVPVLVTPLARNSWKDAAHYNDFLADFADAVLTLGKAENVMVLDLHTWAMALMQQDGLETAKRWFYPGDYTHTNDFGAYKMAGFVAHALGDALGLMVTDAPEWTPTPPFVPLEAPADCAIPAPEGDPFADYDATRPNDTLTRAEALELAIKALKLFPINVYNDLYSDIVGHETYAGTIQCAAQNDLIPPEWVADGSLYPNQTVTAADFLAVLIPGAAGRRPLADAVPVPDSVPVYARRAVGQAVAEGLIAPEALTKPLNRSNAAEICRRLHI